MSGIINDMHAGYDPIMGLNPELRWGTAAPDGDAYPWKSMECGSVYIRKTAVKEDHYRKVKNDQRDDDWVIGLGVISVTVERADMTDGGGASGTYTLTNDTLPIGAFVLQSTLINVTGFTGDTSAVIIVGDGTDTDRYSTGTPSVFTTADLVDLGVPSGTKIHSAAKTPVITITSATDFTLVTAGQLTLRIYYLA